MATTTDSVMKLCKYLPDFDFAIGTGIVLAAWYYKTGKLTIEEAADVAGFESPAELSEYIVASSNKNNNNWAKVGRFFRRNLSNKQHLLDGYTSFRKWTKDKYGDGRYIYRIMHVESVFGGTCVEKLIFRKAALLMKLNDSSRYCLIKNGYLKIKGNKISLIDVDKMKYAELYSLVKADCGTGTRSCTTPHE